MTNRGKMQLIAGRLKDYDDHDVARERAKLVALWRQHFPAAAQEASVALHPLMQIRSRSAGDLPDAPDEFWVNDVYHVTLRRKTDHVFGTGGRMIQLGINTHDGTARHDWREFQAIKNQLAGPECEAFELYPAESRLMDPSNYYALWCFPDLKRIKVGSNEPRRVWNADEALAPQRAF
jgi:hypothetical protein